MSRGRIQMGEGRSRTKGEELDEEELDGGEELDSEVEGGRS